MEFNMSEALKDIYTEEFLVNFSRIVKNVYDDFPCEYFLERVQSAPWESLALRARMNRIAEVLGVCLPKNYGESLDIFYRIDKDCTGFPYLFFPDFVSMYGLSEENWEFSMAALERFTLGSSSEFAIRPFILLNPEKAMEKMQEWSKHPNEHVRRLSSEGCRPRLPWSIDLPIYKKDPAPILALLENLKSDPSLYVRKSVANNLNDIAKDNPEMVLDIAQRWIGTSPETNWILRHGCRTLIKKANPKALTLFGYENPSKDNPLFSNAVLGVGPTQLCIGEVAQLSYSITLQIGAKSNIRLEYGIDFIKSNGKPSRKLFLLSDRAVSGELQVSGTRNHSFADLTTRRHYPGVHRIVLLVNGQEAAETTLLLQEVHHDSK